MNFAALWRCFALSCFVVIVASPAQATLVRAWVSGRIGSDVAACGPISSPCRTLQYAHDNVIAVDGEIDILDPAGYGPVVITKGVAIVNDGVGSAGVQQPLSGQSAITINAGGGSTVFIKGLEIDGLGTGQTGILALTAGNIVIANCTIRHFHADGVLLSPNANGVNMRAVIVSSTLSDNGGSGLHMTPLAASDALAAFVSRSTLANNFGDGAFAANIGGVGNGDTVYAAIADSVIDGNDAGVQAFAAGAAIHLGRNTITGNSTGVLIDPASVGATYADNKIDGNSSGPINGTLTTLAKQ